MSELSIHYWPDLLRIPLFRAAFLEGEAGLQAWESWIEQVNMEDYPDPGSFRLLPQLYGNLHLLGVDDPLMMKLKGIVRRNWFENQRFFLSVVPTLGALHEAGIECMLLGGPALAWEYCTDYALGSDANLTILVPSKQAGHAIDYLQTSGWRVEGGLPGALIEPYISAGWKLSFVDANGQRLFLQWHLLPETCRDEDDAEFWLAAAAARVHDVPLSMLNPADHILYSCAEGVSTGETSLFLRAIDVMLIVQNVPGLDWNHLATQAENHRLVVPLIAVLGYIQANLDGPLPLEVWRQFQSLPISGQERLEYSLKHSRPRVWGSFWQLWFNYRRPNSGASLLQDMRGFPRYLQHIWRLYRLRHVPRQALSIAQQQINRSQA